jgi:Fe-S cluster assembly iron-binding protein IscA
MNLRQLLFFLDFYKNPINLAFVKLTSPGKRRKIHMIKLEPGAVREIREFFAEKGPLLPVRVELQSSGCCDSLLGLRVDAVRENDLVQEAEGLTLVMSPETSRLAGEVTISHVDDGGRKGFIITSSNSVSEWAGFGVCQIMT